MDVMASRITSVYSTVYSGLDQRKHQSSASLAFVWEFTGDRWIPRTKASNAENVSIWWRHHVILQRSLISLSTSCPFVYREWIMRSNQLHKRLLLRQITCLFYVGPSVYWFIYSFLKSWDVSTQCGDVSDVANHIEIFGTHWRITYAGYSGQSSRLHVLCTKHRPWICKVPSSL